MAATDMPAGCILHGVPFGRHCYTCAPIRFFSSFPATPPSPTGWICSSCRRSLSPFTDTCPHCPPATLTFTRDLGPIKPVPVDEPAAGPDDTLYMPARRDIAPESIRAAQEKLNDAAAILGAGRIVALPFGARVLDHRPVLHLPPEMAHEGYNRIARLGAGFTEVLPGLEAAVFLPPNDDGKVVAHFRLTPKDGQEHE